jgi:hypothetical protein
MWFCPTYKRPEGLLELADSWEKYQPGKKLVVRVWEEDPLGRKYAETPWPESWEFYTSSAENFTAAMNEFFSKYPDEETYGFIADDVRLTSEGALEYLEMLASPFFIAYPNDTIQREQLCTHYCIGGDLVRLMGWFSPSFLEHSYTNQVWHLLGQKTGLLRYAPHAVFYHKHFLAPGRGAKFDESYAKIYTENGELRADQTKRDWEIFQKYCKEGALEADALLIKMALGRMENQIVKEAGYEPTILIPETLNVSSNASEPVLQSGDVHRGMGGRDSAGSSHVTDRPACGVQGDCADDDTKTPRSNNQTVEKGTGFPQGGCPWILEEKDWKYKDVKVAVCVPSGGEWESGMAVSTAMLITDFMQFGLPGLRTHSIHLNSTESSMLVSNRHNAVKTMLKHGATHLLFIDSDMKFPPWALRRLLSHDLPVVAANCTRRTFPVQGTAMDFDGKDIDSRGRKGVEAVRQVGGAFMLVRRDVLEKLKPPMFQMEWIPEMGGYCGEDIYFCQLVQAAGFDVMVDHELSMYIGHIGKFIYGWGQLEHKVPNWMPGTAGVEKGWT